MSVYHTPVMLKEVIAYLEIKSGKWYIDCNLGGGGHTDGILKAGGKVLGIDLDPEALAEVANNHQLPLTKKGDRLIAESENLILYQANFAELAEIAKIFNLSPEGVLFDLGVSTHQLESRERGFSFNTDAPLDMRMNPEQGVSAKELINGLYEKELADLFWKLGEERYSRAIAKKIVEERGKGPITHTDQLAGIITSVRHRTPSDRTHPATRVFQALRIAVNDELSSLELALPQALSALNTGGQIVTISFHSLEDRIVKNFFLDEVKKRTVTIVTHKPVEPTEEEIAQNPRSRSGKLRVAQKL